MGPGHLTEGLSHRRHRSLVGRKQRNDLLQDSERRGDDAEQQRLPEDGGEQATREPPGDRQLLGDQDRLRYDEGCDRREGRPRGIDVIVREDDGLRDGDHVKGHEEEEHRRRRFT